MSDCSMAAMKPKMPPKTCGTCDSFVLAKGCDHLGICSEVYFEDEYGNDAFAAVRDTRACDNPSLYKPRMADCDDCPERIPEDGCRVKARCYDLQEAVREMYRALTFCSGGCAEGRPMLDDGCSVCSGSLLSRLGALGVSLDD